MAKRNWLFLGLTACSGVGLYIFSRSNYLFFHTTVEFATIIVGFLIFIISWISRKFNQQSFFLALGPGILVVSLITFLHTITYRGTGIIVGYDANLPTQLWVVLSFSLAMTFFFAIWHENRETKYNIAVLGSVGFGILTTILCFLGLFPVCYVEGVGLTMFKIISEYVIILFYAVCILMLAAKKAKFPGKLFPGMIVILGLLIGSEFMFTLYQNVYGVTNFLGHFLRLLAFILMFQFVVVGGITRPYDTAFAELKDLSIKDGLTKLYNHRFLLEFLTGFQKPSTKNHLVVFLIIFDIDNFKTINDTYGHFIGDEVLKAVANLLTTTLRPSDIAIRHGGDEFSVILTDTDNIEVRQIVQNIHQAFVNDSLTDKKIKVTVSGGVVKYGGEDVNIFLKRADQLLYDAKQNGKAQFIIDF